jgi:hypothetical protein
MQNAPMRVGRHPNQDKPHTDAVWNAAIEAAAKVVYDSEDVGASAGRVLDEARLRVLALKR